MIEKCLEDKSCSWIYLEWNNEKKTNYVYFFDFPFIHAFTYIYISEDFAEQNNRWGEFISNVSQKEENKENKQQD